MIRIGTIGAACLAVAFATASPAFAQGGNRGGGFHGGGAHFGGGGYRGDGFRGAGILPGIAAGVVAGAVLGGGPGYYGGYPRSYDNSYAYEPVYPADSYPNNGYNTYDPGYAARNGFVCQPGTVFRGEDGHNHLCQ